MKKEVINPSYDFSSLYIENDENIEFIMEPEIYNYLENVSNFLKKYKQKCFFNKIELSFDKNNWLSRWQIFINDLIYELFNSYIAGNFISANAMTRSLIEAYVYFKILLTKKDPKLIEEWFICSLIRNMKTWSTKLQNDLKRYLTKYYKEQEIDFEQKWQIYTQNNENSWLKSIINSKRITFNDLCFLIKEPEVHKDYQRFNSFIHSQDILSKLSPFAFYESIFTKFEITMEYIFKTISLFSNEKKLRTDIEELQNKLYSLEPIFLGEIN